VSAGKRQSLSKKTRFEVLKRDKFTCQYCGAQAPAVLLQVDHIQAVANGGTNDILNLISSCEPCNNGKGARAISDESALAKQRDQLAELEVRREQIQMMSEWQNSLVDVESEAVELVLQYYKRLVPGWGLNASGAASIRASITEHGIELVMSKMRATAARCVRIAANGKATDESSKIMTRVLLNELKYKRFIDADPVGSQLRYIRGILRNRVDNVNLAEALLMLEAAYGSGYSIESLRSLAEDARSYWAWREDMRSLVADASEVST
jgi:hypothetical protein